MGIRKKVAKKLKSIALIGISLTLVATLTKKCSDYLNSPEYEAQSAKAEIVFVLDHLQKIEGFLQSAESHLKLGNGKAAIGQLNMARIGIPSKKSIKYSGVDSTKFKELRVRFDQLEDQIRKEVQSGKIKI